jgi:hypothetical protein
MNPVPIAVLFSLNYLTPMNLQYPFTMLDENGAKIVAVSDDQVVLYWQGVEAGRFETSMAAIRYMNAELLPL